MHTLCRRKGAAIPQQCPCECFANRHRPGISEVADQQAGIANEIVVHATDSQIEHIARGIVSEVCANTNRLLDGKRLLTWFQILRTAPRQV